MSDKNLWGTDGSISLPKPMETTYTEMIDMDGFCFTPLGLRVAMSVADTEETLRRGYGPVAIPEGESGG